MAAGDDFIGGQAGIPQALGDDRRVRHIHFALPHAGKHRLHIALEIVPLPGENRAPHQMQGIHRKMRIHAELGDAVFAQEARGFPGLVFGFVAHAGELLHGRAVVGELEYAAEENREVVEARAGAGLDCRNHLVRVITIGAGEIEVVFKFHVQAPAQAPSSVRVAFWWRGVLRACEAGSRARSLQGCINGVRNTPLHQKAPGRVA